MQLLCLIFATLIVPTTQSRINESVLLVSRTDVARAYLAFDRAYHAHPPAETKQAEMNREFDRIALEFATRHHVAAVRDFHALTDSLRPADSPHSAEAKLARALRVRINPFVNSTKSPVPLRLRISVMYAIEIDHPTNLRLQISPILPGEQRQPPLIDREITIETNGLGPSLVIEQPKDAADGRYAVDVVAPDGYRARAGEWYITEHPIEQTRADNQLRLQLLRPKSSALASAINAVAARNGLLSVHSPENDSAQLLLDPIELSRAVAVEIAELEANRDPFVNRPADYWRTITLANAQMPARIFAPQSALNGKPLPVVIALHGAGGDENLFMEGYGEGEIKKQAERRGFLLITPLTDIAMLSPDALDGILRAMEFDYPIDRARVYLIGHSLGALCAQKWNNQKLAAVCQIAGAVPFDPNHKLAPTLLVAGELDELFPLSRLQNIANDAKTADLPVQFRSSPSRGHTLVVGENMSSIVDWLMQYPASHPATIPVKPGK